jgi:hypothetical protein
MAPDIRRSLAIVMTAPAVLSFSVAAASLCGCKGPQATYNTHAAPLTGDARDRQLVLSATSSYLEARYVGNIFGMQHSLLKRSQTLLQEVLNDDAASLKTKGEAADMLGKVDSRLNVLEAAHR